MSDARMPGERFESRGMRSQKHWDNAAMGHLLSALARRGVRVEDPVELHARAVNLVGALLVGDPQHWWSVWHRKVCEAAADASMPSL